ncbi:MAG TPA: hypothetical protein VM925_23325 [Labilithrix sp.]|nr:hypothetical protein [Labilithrix sp.]
MKSLPFRRSLAFILPAVCAAACTPADEGVAASEDELKLEGREIPTSLTHLRAGQPYVPGIDETLLEIGSPCIAGAEVGIVAGPVVSTATVVQNRQTLFRELGLDIPTFNVGGFTGAANVTSKTTFDRQSAVILFQSTGTYKSILSKVADTLPNFQPSEVSRCGYGYVNEASHRVTAALVVTVRSNDSGSEVKAGAGIGKSGLGEMKVNLTNIINKGNLEISVRFATDVIPNLPNAPIGDSVLVIGNNDGDKQAALDKINRSLDWVGAAHASIQTYIDELRKGSVGVSAAPTEKLRFNFYPSTPPSIRKALEKGSMNALSTRTRLSEAYALVDAWERFGSEVADGGGFRWNLPAAPLGTIDELSAKKRELLEDDGGKLTKHRDALDDARERCVYALRNDAKVDTNLASTIARECTPPPALPFDKASVELREIVAVSVTEVKNNRDKCPGGYRRPFEAEAKLFGPWSRSLRASDRGIWMEKSGCTFSEGWIYDGAPGCTPFNSVKNGLTICVSSDKGPTPTE